MGILKRLGLVKDETSSELSDKAWKKDKCPKGGKHNSKYYPSGDGGYYCTKCGTFLDY